MRKLCLLITICISIHLSAQVSEVKEQVGDSYDYYQDAFRKIKSAKSYISDAFDAETIDDIQSYASNANSELFSAKTYVSYVEDLTIKKLTHGNPTMKAKFDGL
jgi:hypothetical protein